MHELSPADAPRTAHPVLWRAWTWVNWFLVPALVFVRGLLVPSGWETLILMLYAPAIVPVVALIAQVPRMILRKRGFTAVPTRIGVLVVAQWVTMTFALWSLYGAGDGPSWPGPLSVPLQLGEEAASWLMVVSLAAWLAVSLVAIVLAFLTRGPEQYTVFTRRPLVTSAIVSLIIMIVVGLVLGWVID